MPSQLDTFLGRDERFLAELWVWCVIGTFIMVSRFVVRYRLVGFAGFKGDDICIIGTFAMHVCSIAFGYLIYWCGTNIDLSEDQVSFLSQAQIEQLVQGSKYQQIMWYIYSTFLWCMKASMLFFYNRLSFCLWQYRWVFNSLCWFTGLSYIVVILTISLSCLPYQDNWHFGPTAPPRCVYSTQNLIVTVVLNVLTDAAILCLPLPVLRDLRVSLIRKLFVSMLICSGIFVIVAAIIRLSATLDSAPSSVTIVRWGIRECEFGVIAINAPVLRPLFTRSFWSRYPAREHRELGRGRAFNVLVRLCHSRPADVQPNERPADLESARPRGVPAKPPAGRCPFLGDRASCRSQDEYRQPRGQPKLQHLSQAPKMVPVETGPRDKARRSRDQDDMADTSPLAVRISHSNAGGNSSRTRGRSEPLEQGETVER